MILAHWLVSIYAIDWWSAAHLAGWGVAAVIALLCGMKAKLVFLLSFIAAIGWEFLEWWLVEGWLNFREPWYNRLLDIPVDMAGTLIGWISTRRFRRVRLPDLVPSLPPLPLSPEILPTTHSP